ncbi:MAG: hypothetical protein AAGH60_03975 [Pseudomonadota bacterium]
MCINVALYGATKAWAMTERGRGSLSQSVERFQVGPSALHWDGDMLVIDVDERTVPLPGRLKGQIRFTPHSLQPSAFQIDTHGRHHWWPYAPSGRIEATFNRPDLTWSGHGYADCNHGIAALEADFQEWQWMRVATQTGASIFYAPYQRDGARSVTALDVDQQGQISPRPVPDVTQLKRGLWGVSRPAWSESAEAARLMQVMVDAPFYTRDAVEIMLDGEPCAGVLENLDLDRFSSRWVKTLLPFRMPRVTRS